MLRTARNVLPLLLIFVAHLLFLFHGAMMLGCGFEATAADPVDDNKDSPNSYSCNCRCSAHPALSVRVSAALDDVENPQTNDIDGAGDLDLGATAVGLRFTSLAIPPGAHITAASVQ